jgi:hypothetical protein
MTCIGNNQFCEFQAKPILESGDAKGLVDPNLNGNFDEVQMQRMVLAATHCITRAARLRPKMSEVQNYPFKSAAGFSGNIFWLSD